MRRHFASLGIIITGFVVLLFSSAGSAEAAYLKFDQTSVSVAASTAFQAQVIVDAGTDQITSSDIWIVYDPTYFSTPTVSPGTWFPTVSQNISSGKIYIAGLIVDPGTYKTGSGTVATVTFTPIKTGSTTLTFDCRTDGSSNTSKIVKNDVNATNIIVCSSNGTLAANIGGTVNPTVAPTAPPATNPTAVPTALPNTGIIDNMLKYVTPGIILLLLGGMLRFIL